MSPRQKRTLSETGGQAPQQIEERLTDRPFWQRRWFIGAALAVATLVAYLPAWNGTPVWDDDVHMTRPEMRSMDGLQRIWLKPGATQQYYPVLHTAFWIAHKLWGEAPLGYHLTNILLHLGSALLLARILSLLKISGAWLAAGIFALHPVHVESVAWISELKNTLSGVCYLGAALAYLKFTRARPASLYALALALFVLGLAAKSVIATLPAALLLILWWKEGLSAVKHNIALLLPFYVLGAGAGLFTAWMERTSIGAEGAEFHFTLIERGLIAGRALWFHLGKLIWPAELIFIYPRWQISQNLWWQYLFPAGALALAVALWSLRNRSRAPLTAFLFFAGTLFPALGFLNVYPFRYSFVADHFQYLASIGPIALAAAGLTMAASRPAAWAASLKSALILALLLSLGLLTWQHAGTFRNMETLWRSVIAKNPEAWLAHNNLGITLLRAGREEEALAEFRRAVEINPNFAEAQNNLGSRLSRLTRPGEAVTHFRKAIERNPSYAEAHNNLGNALLRLERVEEAIGSFRKALEVDPRYAEAHNNLGNAFQHNGRPEEAAQQFRKALELKPDYPSAHYNLANQYLQTGRLEEATAHYKKALEIEPNHLLSLINLGALDLQVGRAEESRVHLEKALALEPRNADARNNLGNTLLRLGRPQEALMHFQTAVEIDPSNVSAANNAAWLMATSPDASLRNGNKALELAEHGDRLAPNNAVIKATLAAALAESGRFEEAATTAEVALQFASGSALLADGIREQVRLHRAGVPSREAHTADQ